MRIFHNKTNNHVIIVTTNLAYSFYNYYDEDPVKSAKRFLATDDGLRSIAVACEEIEMPKEEETNQAIQKGIDMARVELRAKLKNRKEVECEHSQKKNKAL